MMLTPSVIECFNGLHGEAREKAISTGNYDEMVNREREIVEEIDPLDVASQA